MFLSKQLLFICHTPDHHTFKKKASWKYYRYISFKIRIYGLQRFSSFNCPVSRTGLPHKSTLHAGSAAIGRSTSKRNRTCAAILWRVCCRSIIGDWSDPCQTAFWERKQKEMLRWSWKVTERKEELYQDKQQRSVMLCQSNCYSKG